jgi:hypothetical protein
MKKEVFNKLRNKLFISKSMWILIQIITLIVGVIGAYFIGLLIEIKLGMHSFELPVIFVGTWLLLFLFIKFKIEEEFNDCIDE